MKHFLLAATLLSVLGGRAETPSDTLFVYMKSGGFNAFPMAVVERQTTEAGRLVIKTASGAEFSYLLDDVERTSFESPAGPLPSFTSFTIQSKHNDEVYANIESTITDDSEIKITVPSIGRLLNCRTLRPRPISTAADSRAA
jgi:hypothetical protein